MRSSCDAYPRAYRPQDQRKSYCSPSTWVKNAFSSCVSVVAKHARLGSGGRDRRHEFIDGIGGLDEAASLKGADDFQLMIVVMLEQFGTTGDRNNVATLAHSRNDGPCAAMAYDDVSSLQKVPHHVVGQCRMDFNVRTKINGLPRLGHDPFRDGAFALRR